MNLRPMPIIALAACVSLTSGCATMEKPDPIEPFNRRVFEVNEVVDSAVLKPVAKAYANVVPSVVRTGIRNFFSNLDDAWSSVNLVLQGRVVDASHDLARVVTNSTIGVLGTFDVATRVGFERHTADFGQTLGVWGVGAGAYVVLPLFGPSSLRDMAGLSLDLLAAPQGFIGAVPLRNTLTAVHLVDEREGFLKVSDAIDAAALDKYLFVRDAYLQRRRSQVFNGNPPEDNAADPQGTDSPPTGAAPDGAASP